MSWVEPLLSWIWGVKWSTSSLCLQSPKPFLVTSTPSFDLLDFLLQNSRSFLKYLVIGVPVGLTSSSFLFSNSIFVFATGSVSRICYPYSCWLIKFSCVREGLLFPACKDFLPRLRCYIFASWKDYAEVRNKFYWPDDLPVDLLVDQRQIPIQQPTKIITIREV